MSPPSPYGPDRSLSIAAAVLVGSGLLVTAAVYLLTTSAGHFTGRHQTRVAEDQTSQRAWSGPGRPARRSAPSGVASGRGMSLPPAPSHVPAWAGSGTSVPPPRAPAPETYSLRPDMGHADLGPPPGAPKTGRTGAGAPLAETDGATGGPPSAGHAPLAADLGDSPSGASTDWRSEASTLGQRARALSGALARLHRTDKAAKENGRARSNSGDASTAATSGASPRSSSSPDPPGDPPQVPVDGGLGWLAAAGAAYATNRLRKKADEEGDAEA